MAPMVSEAQDEEAQSEDYDEIKLHTAYFTASRYTTAQCKFAILHCPLMFLILSLWERNRIE